MMTGRDDIHDAFSKGDATINGEIERRGISLEGRTESEFKKRVRHVITQHFNSRNIDILDMDRGYETACSLIPNISYTLKDITDLIEDGVIVGRLSGGIYLSALINRVIKPDDELRIQVDGRKLGENLGIFLPCGKLILEGDYEGYLGFRMSGGEIVLNGNCKGDVGIGMGGGKLTIDGDLTKGLHNYGLGHAMVGGEIEVKGNAELDNSPFGGGIGIHMSGGRIIIGGNARDVGCGMAQGTGEIIVKGNISASGDYHQSVCDYMEGGNVRIEGDVYASVGFRMANGTVLINSNVYGRIGQEMKDGDITVHGTAYKHIGRGMKGGSIKIKRIGEKKREPRQIGIEMRGGTITVEDKAECEDIGFRMTGGKIYLNGGVEKKCSVGVGMERGEIHINGPMPRSLGFRRSGRVYHNGEEVPTRLSEHIGRWIGRRVNPDHFE